MLGDDFYKNRLNSDEKAIYISLLKTLHSCDRSEDITCKDLQISFPQTLNNSVGNAIDALTRDHPEIFYISINNGTTYVHYGESLVLRGLKAYTRDQAKRINRLLEMELQTLTECISGLDEWEKARIIYARIASRYKYKLRKECHDYNIVGLLLREEGVCSAYANMLILALRKVGIPCHRISGGGHAWVMAYINDIPLHLDVTWESHSGEESISYSYFCLTSEEISRDHTLPEGILPESRFRGYGYHVKKHCRFSSAKEAKKYIRASFHSGERTVRLRTDCPESIDEIVKASIPQLTFDSFKYFFNRAQGTAIIFKS